MICSKCGQELPDDARVCSHCGAPAGEKSGEVSVRKQNRKAALALLAVLLAVVVLGAAVLVPVAKKAGSYNRAVRLFDAGKFEEAIASFRSLGDYKDSPERMEDAIEAMHGKLYELGRQLMDAGFYEQAVTVFTKLGDYLDSPDLLEQAREALQGGG